MSGDGCREIRYSAKVQIGAKLLCKGAKVEASRQGCQGLCKSEETGVGCQVTGVGLIQVSGNRCSGGGKLDTVQRCKSERSSCAKVQRCKGEGKWGTGGWADNPSSLVIWANFT